MDYRQTTTRDKRHTDALEASIRRNSLQTTQERQKAAQNDLKRELEAYKAACITFSGRQLRGKDVSQPPAGPLRALWSTMYTLYCACCTDPNRYGPHPSDAARRKAGLPNAAYTRCYFELEGNRQPDW